MGVCVCVCVVKGGVNKRPFATVMEADQSGGGVVGVNGHDANWKKKTV